MIVKEFTVTLKGPLWRIYEVSIENIDLTSNWEDEPDKGWIKVMNFKVSDDDLVDIYIKLGAPNGTKYTIEIGGMINDNSSYEISFSKEYRVEKNGILRIQLSLPLSDLII